MKSFRLGSGQAVRRRRLWGVSLRAGEKEEMTDPLGDGGKLWPEACRECSALLLQEGVAWCSVGEDSRSMFPGNSLEVHTFSTTLLPSFSLPPSSPQQAPAPQAPPSGSGLISLPFLDAVRLPFP